VDRIWDVGGARRGWGTRTCQPRVCVDETLGDRVGRCVDLVRHDDERGRDTDGFERCARRSKVLGRFLRGDGDAMNKNKHTGRSETSCNPDGQALASASARTHKPGASPMLLPHVPRQSRRRKHLRRSRKLVRGQPAAAATRAQVSAGRAPRPEAMEDEAAQRGRCAFCWGGVGAREAVRRFPGERVCGLCFIAARTVTHRVLRTHERMISSRSNKPSRWDVRYWSSSKQGG
jgi:hypothetical protein